MGTDSAIDIAARISGATTDFAGRMTGAIRDAARQTGAGFDYLLNTALRESNLNPNAKAKTSSATGLFQFIDQTWLGTLKQSGPSLGYGKYADAISRTPQGRFVVNDPTMREQIFALRKDPTANAVMAGAFANSNAKVLTDRLGRKPSDGELYIAHFLGASGAARFISAAEARPDTKAASLFPKAAAANQGIFYDRAGGAKSLKQVYAGLISKHDVIGSTRFAAANPVENTKAVQSAKAVTETAAAAVQKLAALPIAFFRDLPPVRAAESAVTSSTSIAPASRIADAHAAVAATAPARTTVVPPAKAVTPATGATAPAGAATATDTMAFAPEPVAQSKTYPMFQSLFHENGRGAVAPVVRELWGARGLASTETPTAVAPAADASAPEAARVKGPLDLMRFTRPSTRRPA
jgi:hypothetical protein